MEIETEESPIDISINNSSLTITPSSSPSATLQLNETTLKVQKTTSMNNTTPPDFGPAAFNSITYAPTTAAPSIAQTINSPTFNPSSEPTTQQNNNGRIPYPMDTPWPTDASNTYEPIATPTYVYSPPSKEVTIDDGDDDVINSTIIDSPSSATATQISTTESPSSNSTSSTTSFKPTTYPTHEYDESLWQDDWEDEVWQDDWGTYYEFNSEPTYEPTNIKPTFYPTTLKKGERIRERKEKNQQKKNQNQNPPTESPTVVKKEFLEDVSASKALPMVIGLILTILGIGCCAWCV